MNLRAVKECAFKRLTNDFFCSLSYCFVVWTRVLVLTCWTWYFFNRQSRTSSCGELIEIATEESSWLMFLIFLSSVF